MGVEMKSRLTVTGSYTDESVSVHFETDVTHRRAATPEEIQAKAKAKMRTFLRRSNPGATARLTEFSFSPIVADDS